MKNDWNQTTYLTAVCLLLMLGGGGIVWGVDSTDGEKKPRGFTPPVITSHPEGEVAYKLGEPVVLPCEATGDPAPRFHWKRNDTMLNIDGTDMRYCAGLSKGSLCLDSPSEKHNGLYQCFAENDYGTAVSVKVSLKQAVLELFVSKDVVYHRPVVGRSLVLRCNPPNSYPRAVVYWGESTKKLRPIETNDRISLDYNGNLYFANINNTDRLSGRKYVCLATNPKIRSLVQGDDQIIEPQEGDPVPMAPTLVWYSAQPTGVVLALKDHDVKMKCIFSGYPTPTIIFSRIEGELDSRMIIPDDSHGQELEIRKVNFSDAGLYMCSGSNFDNDTEVSQTFRLTVESTPYWINDRPPESVEAGEGDNVVFDCWAEGLPSPSISWFINGVPIESLPADPRRTVVDRLFKLSNVTLSDNQVVQCIASNKHGSILANAFLYVGAEEPTFVETLPDSSKVVEGRNLTLPCRGKGAPKPLVEWFIGNSTTAVVSGDRISILSSGHLQILDLELFDENLYHCRLTNRHGTLSTSGYVIVFKKISVSMAHPNQTSTAGDRVTFLCHVTADSYDVDSYDVYWLKDGQPIDLLANKNVYRKDEEENSLTVLSSKVMDSGLYSCAARTGLDEAESGTTHLLVKARPDPPIDVQHTSCTGNMTVLSWRPGNNNNDALLSHKVMVNTSVEEPGTRPTIYEIKADEFSVEIPLAPYRHYTFYVTSRNSVGSSEPTVGSRERAVGTVEPSPSTQRDECFTPPARPAAHPSGVCSEQRNSTQLVIIWKPLNRSQLNGPDFYYLVSYQLRNQSGAVEEQRHVTDHSQSELVVNGQQPFQAYTVYVKAFNGLGEAGPGSRRPERKVVYSGEAAPLVKPEQFGIDKSSLNSSGVEFTWQPVTDDPQLIRGYFKGYQIRYWKVTDPDRARAVDVVLHPPSDLCPSAPDDELTEFFWRRRRRRQSEDPGSTAQTSGQIQEKAPVRAYVGNLWPATRIMAGVVVMNGAKLGELSDTVEFETPPGPPGAVSDLMVVEKGSYHFKITWEAPDDPTGSITGYTVTYRTDEPGSIEGAKYIAFPRQRSTQLLELIPDSLYRVTVCAVGVGGCGKSLYTDERTLEDSAPDEPAIDVMVPGETSANISWHRVVDGEKPLNPATEFFVEFRRLDDTSELWLRSAREKERDWLNVTELFPDTAYAMRVVAANQKHETRSKIKGLIIEQPTEAPVKIQSASSPVWIVIIFIVLLLIVLIIVMACIIYRKRGGSYPVFAKEKEKEKGTEKLWEEPPFAEYSVPSRPLHTHSQASLISGRSEPGSDIDSLLGEYEDNEETKFNEDGSFIGLYGGSTARGAPRDGETEEGEAANGAVPVGSMRKTEPGALNYL